MQSPLIGRGVALPGRGPWPRAWGHGVAPPAATPDLGRGYNHDRVITHLEPDILECEIKWALGSITINKASDGSPVEIFQILKDDAVKLLH